LPKHLQTPKKDPALPESELTLGRLVVKDFSNSKVLDRLLMYERRIENSLYKTMHELQRLKLIKNINTQHEAPPNSSPRDSSQSLQPAAVEPDCGIRSKMQNEPNFKNPQINVTPFPTSNYGKLHRRRQPKNEPNSNPIYTKSNPILVQHPVHRSLGEEAGDGGLRKTKPK